MNLSYMVDPPGTRKISQGMGTHCEDLGAVGVSGIHIDYGAPSNWTCRQSETGVAEQIVPSLLKVCIPYL